MTPQLRTEVPVTLYLFCVLAVDGHSTTALPYLERRSLLDDLVAPGPREQVPPFWTDTTGEQMLALAREHHLEGVVAKRIGSPYQPGRRSPDWLKHPIRSNTEGIIVGWLPGSGTLRVGSGR